MSTPDYGPQTAEIAALIDRARRLTVHEGAALAAAWDVSAAARDDAWAAWYAAGDAWYAARAAARDAAWDAAWAAWYANWAAARDAARAAAGDAAVALVVRDLIGQRAFTQEHYDLLTRPWATVVGPAHPDDAPIGGTP